MRTQISMKCLQKPMEFRGERMIEKSGNSGGKGTDKLQ
jgi:hypothetical protein